MSRRRTNAQRLRAAGWTNQRFHGNLSWHRGIRCAGDRYWHEGDAVRIMEAEERAGKTLWPSDPEWPQQPGSGVKVGR